MIYKAVDNILNDLRDDIELTVSEEIEYAYYLGYAFGLMAEYDSVGIIYTYDTIIVEVKEMVNTEVLFKIKRATVNDLLQVTRNTDFMVKKLVQETMGKHLTARNLLKTGRQDLVGLVLKDLRGKGLEDSISNNMIAIVDKAGRRWKVNTYVDMVVQTKAHQVYVQGIKDFSSSHGGKGDLARIPHNPLTKDACLKHEGKIISMTGATAGYETYDYLQSTGDIFHPRCRHAPIPYWDEDSIPKDKNKIK
jgi:hypothetical protein